MDPQKKRDMEHSASEAHMPDPNSEENYTKDQAATDLDNYFDPAFATRYLSEPIPKNTFPEGTMPARVVQQIIRDFRQMDATPRLNLASFVTTWMEPEVNDLIMESLNVNYIDEAEYPSTTEIQNHCVAMLANLLHAPEVVGTSCIGSSEAILLSGLAMKRRWITFRKEKGLPYDKPSLICSSAVHVCWEKLGNYFDIDIKYINISEDRFILDLEKVRETCDENTIGVVGILGTTYTGHFEDIKGLDKVIGEVNEKNGWQIVVHVDGASGAFVAPFLYPNLEWDFRLKNVASINASGHKFGLVYPGLGWILFREKKFLPDSLVFHDNYLGNDQISFTLNFSKGAYTIVAQYYQFLRLGRVGYTKIFKNLAIATRFLSKGISDMDHFHVMSAEKALPLVAFSLKPSHRGSGFDEFDIADKLRERGWVVPAYTMAPGAESIKIMRVTIREDFSLHSAETFLEDLDRAVKWLDAHYVYTKEQLTQVNAVKAWKSLVKSKCAAKGTC